MRRKSLPAAMALLVAAAACGPAKVDVSIQISSKNPVTGETTSTPGKDLEVRMLPFDRDSVFDSLAAAYGTPEPPIPTALQEQRDSVRVAQQRWQQAEVRWGELRDTLQKLNTAMGKYNKAESQYAILYHVFNDLDAQYRQVNREKTGLFDHFTTLQKSTFAASDSIKILRANWADEAFQNVDKVFAAKEKAIGRKIAVDTTDANGATEFRVDPGRWWITARYQLPFTELYWNVPFDVKRGKPLQVELTRENAKERERM